MEREKRSRRKVFVFLIIFCPLPSGDLETTGWRRTEEEDRRASSLNLEAVVLGGGDFQQENPTLNKGGERRTLANSHKVLTDFVFIARSTVCALCGIPRVLLPLF